VVLRVQGREASEFLFGPIDYPFSHNLTFKLTMKTDNVSERHFNTAPPDVRVIASPKSWIEGEAVRQLYATAKFPGVKLAIGFPDLHPGKGTPVGAAFVTDEIIYPHIIGGDIGCGMALFKTNLLRRDAKLDRWSALRFNLEHSSDGDMSQLLAAHDLESTEFDRALGTLGGGNHFAELQAVEKIVDAREFKRVGIGKEQLVALVHSGSRGLGESILRNYVDEHRVEGAPVDSLAAREYLRGHDFAVRWARVNRAAIAKRFVSTLGAEAECVWDGCHNSVSARETGEGTIWVHRKGVVENNGSPVVIPGSRGALSYLVKPIGEGARHAWSLAHGAGRKWSRSETRLRMRERFGVMELTQTPLGSRVICEERDLLYEEAPVAYKNIESVIQDLVAAGLVSVIATFRPLLTYKTRKLNY
jgi:release factor H-coupled RctB family protein